MNDVPVCFGEYHILGELGRGGMGVVYQAVHRRTKRDCALKLLREMHIESATARARFLVEAQAASPLNHPNIVALRNSGDVGGVYFLEMELINGVSLAERLAHDRIDIRTAVRWVAKVANAVQCANSHGVLHRDIKPGNVLIDSEDVAKLTDFGMARILNEASDLTGTISSIGTPAYMAPELARGGARDASVGADVYGLGAILYEVLSGQPPYKGESAMSILLAVQQEAPPRLSSQSSHIPRDLVVICERAMQREVADRFESAGEFAKELERWLRGEPIRSSPVPIFRRIAWWGRRHPALASLSTALFVAVMAGYGVTEWQRRAARDTSRRLMHQLSVSEMSRAGQSFDQGLMHVGLATLAETARRDPDNMSVAIQLALRMTHPIWPRPEGEFAKGAGRIEHIVPAANGEWVATGSEEGWIHQWIPATGGLHGEPLFHEAGRWVRLNYHADSRWILSLKASGSLRVWSALDGREAFSSDRGGDGVPPSKGGDGVPPSSGGDGVSPSNEVGRTSGVTPSVAREAADGFVHEALFYPIHPMIVVAAEGQPVRQIQLRNGEMRWFEGTEGTRHMALDGNAIRLATSRGDDRVHLWNPFSREFRGTIEVGAPVVSLAFGGVERYIAVGTAAGEVIVYNVTSLREIGRRRHAGINRPIFALHGKVLIHEHLLGSLWYSPAPDFSAVGAGFRSAIPSWGIKISGDQRYILQHSGLDRLSSRTLNDSAHAGKFSESIPIEGGSKYATYLHHPMRVAVARESEGVVIWKLDNYHPAPTQFDLGGRILSVGFTPDESAMHLIRRNGRLDEIRLPDMSTRTIQIPRLRRLHHATFSPGGRHLAIASPIGITLHNLSAKVASNQGEPSAVSVDKEAGDDVRWQVLVPPLESGPVKAMVFSPSGETLAIVDQAQIRLWNLNNHRFVGEPVPWQPVAAIPNFVSSLRPTPAMTIPVGTSLATDTETDAETEWNSITESSGNELDSPFEIASIHVEFSPNGRHVLLVEAGRPLCLIETATGVKSPGPRFDESRELFVTHARWLPDGQRIAVAVSDGSVRFWEPFQTRSLASPLKHPLPIVSMDVEKGGRRMVTFARDRMVRVWDVASGELIVDHALGPYFTQASFHPQGHSIQCIARRGAFHLIDPKTGLAQTEPRRITSMGGGRWECSPCRPVHPVTGQLSYPPRGRQL